MIPIPERSGLIFALHSARCAAYNSQVSYWRPQLALPSSDEQGSLQNAGYHHF
jgi:hypothetical protein